MKNIKQKIIVIKYGSSSVTNKVGMDHARLSEYAANLAQVHKHYGVVIVSSGSVAAGRSILNSQKSDMRVADARVLAMLGSGAAFIAWQQALLGSRIVSGQLLITHREVEDPTEGPSLLAALMINLSNDIITVANENDALSDTELAKLSYGGDNDGLAAHLAVKLEAHALCLLTDQEGLLDEGNVVAKVSPNQQQRQFAIECVKANSSAQGRGGMLSKVEAAIKTSIAGIETYIANADTPIDEILKGNKGTHFVAEAITK